MDTVCDVRLNLNLAHCLLPSGFINEAPLGPTRLDVTKNAIFRGSKSSICSVGVAWNVENFNLARRLTEVTEVWRKVTDRKLLILKAGDGDRTRDVQLGKLAFYR